MFKFTYFIFVFFTFSVHASTFLSELEELSESGDMKAKLTLSRIKLYELDAAPIPQSLDIFLKDSTQRRVKKRLNDELYSTYKDHLISSLGCLDDKNCLKKVSTYQVLKSERGDVCFPGTNCEFYKCMEKKYSCHNEGVNYFTELAYPTCSTYVKNISQGYFSENGIEWIYEVMVCLQKGLVKECDLDNSCDKETRKKSCDHIVDYTLNFHPSCYLESGVGVCRLPLKDKINIWRTVSKFLTRDEREQAYRVVFKCVIGELSE